MRIHFEYDSGGTWVLCINGSPYVMLSDHEMTELIRAVDELKGRQ